MLALSSRTASTSLAAIQPERLEFLGVSPNYFSLLGAVPQVGRLFGSQDFALGFADGAVISDGLWRRSYGGDPNVLGKRVRLDNDPYTIVGVLPAGFRHPGATVSNDVEVWATAGFSADPFPKPARNMISARSYRPTQTRHQLFPVPSQTNCDGQRSSNCFPERLSS